MKNCKRQKISSCIEAIELRSAHNNNLENNNNLNNNLENNNNNNNASDYTSGNPHTRLIKLQEETLKCRAEEDREGEEGQTHSIPRYSRTFST